jgi:hypothetical protein
VGGWMISFVLQTVVGVEAQWEGGVWRG